jgi:DNA-binding IclR family transcriptional regulator
MQNEPEIRATANSVRLLDAVARHDGVTLQELATETDFSLSTVHDHLATLEDLDFVVKGDDGYHVGLGALEYGGRARARFRSYLSGREEMRSLATDLDALVQVAVAEADRCVYVYQYGQQLTSLERPHLGTHVDLHSSAAGKAILSTIDPDRLPDRLEELTLREHTARTTTDLATLESEIGTVRETKLAYDYQEHFEGVDCVATPVEFPGGRDGAISVSVAAGRYEASDLESHVADAVHKAGRVIEMTAKYDEVE